MSRYLIAVWLAGSLTPAWAEGHRPLLPRPQKTRYGGGQLKLRGLSIRFAAAPSHEDTFAAEQLSGVLAGASGSPVSVSVAPGAGGEIVLIRSGEAGALPQADERPGPDSRESYRIKVTPAGAEIRARSSAGLFYAVQTVRQLIEGNGEQAALPEVEIEDWPALAYRGFMMDLSHGPLLKEEEIERQLDFLARWKANQYYFYSEVSIELKGYPLVNPRARYSQEQIRRIVAYGRERHIDVVPCLEYYGHLHDFFRIERYADMSALPHGGELNPRNARMREILKDWIGQMVALFPSPWFHIGLDEPFELEAAGVEAAGGVEPAKLYLEQLQFVSSLVRGHGKRVLFWADVNTGARIFSKYPQLVSQLPPGTIPVSWDYEARKDWTDFVKPFADAKVPAVIATGLWIWNEVVPDHNRTFSNVDGFLSYGRKYGAIGLIHTGWHDAAQALYRMALPGMAYAAVAAWQSQPVDRASFYSDYALDLYKAETAEKVAPALHALEESHVRLETALGRNMMHRFWDDPLDPVRLKRSAEHREDLRQARLKAEDAQEYLLAALEREPDAPGLASLLAGARMLDYLGQKHIFAQEIAGYFQRLGPKPSHADVYLFLGYEASSQDHSRALDLMDAITGLREDYRAAWEVEYAPYRMWTALGRWDAEYEYWRRLHTRLQELARAFKDGDTLPPLESLRPKQ